MIFDDLPIKGTFMFNEKYDMDKHKYNEYAINHIWIKLNESDCVSMKDITAYIKYVPKDTLIEVVII